ncbi:MAG: hypothetical protein RMK99_13710 [Anaerolineales bacterium]|nr:hypothetical protein [Anaerolineales bacterium]
MIANARRLFALVAALSVCAAALPRLVLAQPPSAITFQPTTVSNSFSSTILVTGTGILPGAQVALDGYGLLSTTQVTTGTLTAVVPAGLPAGAYTLRVINPNGESATAATALTITGPTPTPQPTAFVRPQLIVVSYGASSPTIAPGADYDFEMTVQNAGGETATNVVAEFVEGDFLPRVTGGLRALGSLAPGQTNRFFQPLYATRAVAEKRVASLEVKITYTTAAGANYSDSFTLTFPVVVPVVGTARPTATPTARPLLRPQLVVGAYRTTPEKLQPGFQFELELDVQNVGNVIAKRITLIVGGVSLPSDTGTPGPGGISGDSGSFTDFAPLGTSNVQSLGDLEATRTLTARQKLIVNATTKAGAYPLKLSFVHSDESGRTYTDNQVITVLVFQIPQLEISFYREVGPLFAGQPNVLPVQVVNLGRNPVVLGNMRVSAAAGAQFSNNVLLIGTLDPGGTFPLDAVMIPEAPGPLELTVTIDYTDDFNQPQKITAVLPVEVMEGVPIEPGAPGGEFPGGGEMPKPQPETLWDTILRFLRGLFGLGSGRPQPGPGMPPVETPMPAPVIVP